jgi:hypothetical protein
VIRYLLQPTTDDRKSYRVELSVRSRADSRRAWTTIGTIEKSVGSLGDGRQFHEGWHIRLFALDGRNAGATTASTLNEAKAWIEKVVLKAYGDYASDAANHIQEGGTGR